MNTFRIDGKALSSWDEFHDYFSLTFDFPDYYGRNMDAWIDCMSDYGYATGLVCLHIENAVEFKNQTKVILLALV